MKRPPGQAFADRVRAYYANNPEEALTAADMAIKFDVSLYTARTVLKQRVRDGIVVYAPLPVYVAGPNARRAAA